MNHRRLPAWLAVAGLAVLLTAGAAAADAGHGHQRDPQPAAVTVHAAGLTNPRHLRFGPDGHLYVAEAGIGGPSPALGTPECPAVDNLFSQDGPYMAGFTGRISRILPDGTRETVAGGLPSVHDNFGDALGPSDIAWIGRTMYAVIEGGGCSRGFPEHPAGVVRINRDGSYDYVADISAFIRANPVAAEPACGAEGDCEPDGVPHSLLADGRWLYVVETNHNSVLRVDPRSGAITRVADLSEQDPAPIVLARRGHAYYLGGFDGLVQKFDHRFRGVRTVDEGHGPIVEMDFIRGRLHLLETFALETPWTPGTGRVIRRERNGRRTVIAEGLDFPIGMAYDDGHLYVSIRSYGQGAVEGQGAIVRIRLH